MPVSPTDMPLPRSSVIESLWIFDLSGQLNNPDFTIQLTRQPNQCFLIHSGFVVQIVVAMPEVKRAVALLVLVTFSIFVRSDQTKPELDGLFRALEQSADLIKISTIQNEIWALWYELPEESRALQTIFDQGMRALHFGQPTIAIDHFSRVIGAAPKFSEGWNRRATAYFMVGDFEASLRDIQQTLILEPRHFGALGGLSMILEDTRQYDKAIQTEKLLLELMPENGLIRKRIEYLQTQALESHI